MNAWPVQNRKEFHDAVMAKINRNGLRISSSMPPINPNFVPTNELDKIKIEPFRRDSLPTHLVNDEENSDFPLKK